MQNFEILIKTVKDNLGPGIRKKGNSFYYINSGNFGIINFQKSNSSTRHWVSFTINLGIVSTKLIQAIEGEDFKNRIFSFVDSQWKGRVGSLLPGESDHWWELDQNTPIEQLASAISRLIKDVIIPFIDNRITDEKLKEAWMEGDDGLSELERFVYLTTLMKATNDERLSEICEYFLTKFQGRFFENQAKEHILELNAK